LSVVSVAFALTAAVHAIQIATAATPTDQAVITATAVTPPSANIRHRGIARVLDGDTIEVGAMRIRLEGIDAPEGEQTCNRRLAGTWACGTAATYALIGLVQGRDVQCDDRGQDKYNRTLGICFVDGRDINAEMVRLGLAWAFVRYSNAYVAEEAEARAAKRGVWTSQSMTPWDFRAGKRAGGARVPVAGVALATIPNDGCTIKGNVTRFGRIYHLPTSPWYDRIKMDETQGRRWFCNEGEAIAAGWRPVWSPLASR
jgi:endonuclease YncB( thermonuclease family)